MYLLNGLPAYLGVGFIHLTIINLIVIIVEWALLKRISKVSQVRAFYIALANIVSALLSLIAASVITDNIGGNFWDGYINESRSKRAFIIGLLLFILFTILIEAPFYYLAIRKRKGFFFSLKLSAIINMITNIPIAVYYYVEKVNYVDD
jgi:MFS family permease